MHFISECSLIKGDGGVRFNKIEEVPDTRLDCISPYTEDNMSKVEVTESLPKSNLTMSSGQKVLRCEFHTETETLYLILDDGSDFKFPDGIYSVNMHKNVKKWLTDEKWAYVL